MKPPSIPVSPAVLLWARGESGYAVDEVAHKLGVKEERLAAWERGERQPTMHQIEKLAHVYRRPLGLFFQPAPPALAPLAAEYRRLPGVVPGNESPEFRFAVRRLLEIRDRTAELLDELGDDVFEFTLRAHLSESPMTVGARLREAMRITVAQQRAWRSGSEAWNAWREAADRLGVIVVQFPKVPVKEARGISVLHFPLPVAGVNGREAPEVRSYTLFHEVIHLMLAAGRDELPAMQETRDEQAWGNVERFVETAASHALVPDDALTNAFAKGIPPRWTVDVVRHMARQFRISPLAMATRLRAAGAMSWDVYTTWKVEWNAWLEAHPVKSFGRASQAERAASRSGRPFARLVIEALDANRITSTDAAHYLDLRFLHVAELRKTLGATGI